MTKPAAASELNRVEIQEPEKQAPAWQWPLLATISGVLLLTFIPNIASRLKYGTWAYWSNSDNLVYMAYHKANYLGSWTMHDPYRPAFESGPVLYSWLQTVPASRLIGTLGGGPEELIFFWRFAGAVSLGFAAFLLFYLLIGDKRRGAWLASAASLVFISDPGSIDGRSFLQPWLIAFQRMARPGEVVHDDLVLPFFRVITPLPNYALVLLAIAALWHATTRRRAIVAGVLLGLNILVYFFYWTALLPLAGAVMTIAFIAGRAGFNRDANREYAKNLLIALCVGVAIGLPDILLKRGIQTGPGAQAILDRLCRGQAMPAGDPMRSIHLLNYFYFLELAALTLAAIILQKRHLWLFWLASVIGYLLTNSAIITGLEFENYHWRYISFPMLEIGLILAVIEIMPKSNHANRIFYGIAIVYFSLGLGLRLHDSLVARQPAYYRELIRQTESLQAPLRALQLDGNAALVGPGELDWLALYTRAFQLYQEPYSAHISMLSDTELVRRHALNGYLMGLQLHEYQELVAPRMCGGCSVLKNAWLPENVRRARVGAFVNLTEEEANRAVADYSAVVVMRPADDGPPPRCGPWELIAKNRYWVIWKKSR